MELLNPFNEYQDEFLKVEYILDHEQLLREGRGAFFHTILYLKSIEDNEKFLQLLTWANNLIGKEALVSVNKYYDLTFKSLHSDKNNSDKLTTIDGLLSLLKENYGELLFVGTERDMINILEASTKISSARSSKK